MAHDAPPTIDRHQVYVVDIRRFCDRPGVPLPQSLHRVGEPLPEEIPCRLQRGLVVHLASSDMDARDILLFCERELPALVDRSEWCLAYTLGEVPGLPMDEPSGSAKLSYLLNTTVKQLELAVRCVLAGVPLPYSAYDQEPNDDLCDRDLLRSLLSAALRKRGWAAASSPERVKLLTDIQLGWSE